MKVSLALEGLSKLATSSKTFAIVCLSFVPGVYYFLLDVDTPIKGVKIVSEVGRVGKRAQYGELLRDLLNMLQK